MRDVTVYSKKDIINLIENYHRPALYKLEDEVHKLKLKVIELEKILLSIKQYKLVHDTEPFSYQT